jgi:hypothetical protein
LVPLLPPEQIPPYLEIHEFCNLAAKVVMALLGGLVSPVAVVLLQLRVVFLLAAAAAVMDPVESWEAAVAVERPEALVVSAVSLSNGLPHKEQI